MTNGPTWNHTLSVESVWLAIASNDGRVRAKVAGDVAVVKRVKSRLSPRAAERLLLLHEKAGVPVGEAVDQTRKLARKVGGMREPLPVGWVQHEQSVLVLGANS